MRRLPILLTLLAGGIAGVALLILSDGPARETARDVAQSLDVVADPPFTIRLSGPLWEHRTITSGDGAPDVGYVTSDERLGVLVTGTHGTKVAQVELRVDGRLQHRVRRACSRTPCPTRMRLALTPRIAGPAGTDRRIEVTVRDPEALGAAADLDPHVGVATFAVHVDHRLPPVLAAEPVTVNTVKPRPDGASSNLGRAGMRVLSGLRRRGSLDALLGATGLRVVEAGELEVNGRPLGASLLLELTPARRNVSATVPEYVPAANSPPGYLTQSVGLRATVLRDLLMDVDLGRDRVIALEPGPRSQTKAWAPSVARAPAGAEDED